jgi:CheW-like domain
MTQPAPVGFQAIAQSAAALRAAPRIGFRAHPALPWLVLPEGLPMQVLMDAAPVRVPNTHPWFLGVVSQRGVLLPVFDLAAWAGLTHEAATRTQIVSIGNSADACAMRCSGMPTLLTLAPVASPAAGDGPLDAYLADGFDTASGSARRFDIARWLAIEAPKIEAGGAIARTG